MTPMLDLNIVDTHYLIPMITYYFFNDPTTSSVLNLTMRNIKQLTTLNFRVNVQFLFYLTGTLHHNFTASFLNNPFQNQTTTSQLKLFICRIITQYLIWYRQIHIM